MTKSQDAVRTVLDALDVLCEALERVEVSGQIGDVEDYDRALADAQDLLAWIEQGSEDA